MKKKLWIILGSIISLIILVVGLYFLEESFTDVVILGGKKTESTIYEEYNDRGIDLYHNGKLINKNDYTYEVNSNVNKDIIGKYTVTYDIKYHLRNIHVEREVIVLDNVEPVITADATKIERDYCTKKDKKTLKYSALDNYDGDVSEKVERVEVDGNMLLLATDNSGNTAKVSIPIDYGTKPSNYIKLNGGSTIYVRLNNTYKEQGANYYDGCGEKLDDPVQITGSVNTKKEGTYTLTYTVSDGTKTTRKVVVYKESQSVITGNGNGKIIYLTFDDGPGRYTKQILNTLAKYNVKATFFVTNQFPSYISLIRDEYQAGHTVAVHTYSHNYSVIYKSVDAYVNDFNKMNNIIETYTGTKSRLFRFPGGSSNTVSRSYSKGVVTKIAQRMTSNGYTYFDWDVSSGDAEGASSSKIYSKVVSGASWCSKCVVLMHDIKSTTANALDNILKTLLSKGYRFGTLSSSSPTAHHKIAN